MDVMLFNIVGIIAVTLVAGWYFYRRHIQLAKVWQGFANDNLLTLERRGALRIPIVTGRFHDRTFKLYHYTLSSGISNGRSTTYCRVRLTMDPVFAGRLELSHEGIIAKLGKAAFKTEDIQLNDMNFDSHYVVKCSDPQLPNHVLKGRTREKLLEFRNWWFTWEGERAEAARMGLEYKSETLRAITEILSEVAKELEQLDR